MSESIPPKVGLELTDMKNTIVSIESVERTFNEEITIANIEICFFSAHDGCVE